MGFEGIYPAAPTPFTANGEKVDEGALRTIIDHLIGQGVQGFFALGSTGEGPMLTLEEHKRINDIFMEQCKGRVRVFMQIGRNLLSETIEMAKYAAKSGVDGVAGLLPWFYACDSLATVNYFETLSKAVSGTPLFIYNIPVRTGNTLTFEALEELCKRCPNMAGVKESGSLENIEQWLRLQNDNFRVFCGNDLFEYDSYKIGVRSIVAAFATWMPETFLAFDKAANAGDWDEAQKQQDRIKEVITPIIHPDLMPNLNSSIKAGLKMQGLPAGFVRPPNRELTDEETERVHKALLASGFLKE